MPSNRTYAKVDRWFVRDLIDATNRQPEGNIQVTIPEFQRQLVWNKKQQKGLIDSIKKGYPFGALLLYEGDLRAQNGGTAKRQYSLIDGLQRTQALRTYVQYPNSFFSASDLDETVVQSVCAALGRFSKENKNKIRRAIVKWVQGIQGFNESQDWGINGLVNVLVSDVLRIARGTDRFWAESGKLSNDENLRPTLARFLQSVREGADVTTAEIPVIIYNGAGDDLHKIFELLNSQGTPLSRLEILAAQWIHEKRHYIDNQDITEAIWKKYDALDEAGYRLEIVELLPDAQARLAHEYTLFEYLFGFGKYLSEHFPLLFKATRFDVPDTLSFNLVAGCLGLFAKEMDKLPSKIENLNIGRLEACIIASTQFVNAILRPILSPRQKNRKRPIYHSEFMIISLIATTFQLQFGRKDLSENESWPQDRKILKKHLLMHYLYEVLQKSWLGSADKKLLQYVNNLHYFYVSPPKASQWTWFLDTWYDDTQLNYEHHKRRISESRGEYLLLRYLFAREFPEATTFRVELNAPFDKVDSEKWPLNTIGNLRLLPEDYFLLSGADDASTRERLWDKETFKRYLRRSFETLKEEFLHSWADHIPE